MPDPENQKMEVLLLVSGLVQGVCFRMYTEQEARRLGLNGWVRNLPDGRVEILAQGDEETLDKFIQWCHQGPRWARVQDVAIKKSTIKKPYDSFGIR